LGIFGGILFASIYGMLFYITYQIYRKTQKYKVHSIAFLGFWIAYLFQNLLNNLIFIPQLNVLVWVVTALLFKGLYLERQEEKI
jgi:O-antigen ligase